MKVIRSLMQSSRIVVAVLYATTFFVGFAAAQNSGVGTIEGRVANDAQGTYLGNARVAIGATLETFTDQFGRYRLASVPAGEARVRVFYTGFPEQERVVKVAAGRMSCWIFLSPRPAELILMRRLSSIPSSSRPRAI